MKQKIKIISIVVVVFFVFSLVLPQTTEARSGCCSWHGGVCTYQCPDGTSVGYMCCDGTSLSATCDPYYPDCPKYTPKPAPKPAIELESESKPVPEPEPELEQVEQKEQPEIIPDFEKKLKSELEPEPTEESSQTEPESESKAPSRESLKAAVIDAETIDDSYGWIGLIVLLGIIGGIIYAVRKIIKKKKKKEINL